MIYCHKLKKEAPAMSFAPYPGELGNRILQNISQPAWDMWLEHQTMIINEYRLNMLEPEAREKVRDEMIRFLFEGGAEKPPGYTESA